MHGFTTGSREFVPADVVELVDTRALGARGASRGGSSPFVRIEAGPEMGQQAPLSLGGRLMFERHEEEPERLESNARSTCRN